MTQLSLYGSGRDMAGTCLDHGGCSNGRNYSYWLIAGDTASVHSVLRMEEEKEEHTASENKTTRSRPTLQEMILEYAWTHKMKDLQEVVDTSLWMEAKHQYTLKEPWRLRVASAQACSLMKRRDVGRYEGVIMSFLDASYRLLPTLVVAIKHMKIMFGLKTVVIMWMLKQGQGVVPIVIKILQFFPSKLPQYQDHCSNHEMFLMRKNHLDFKLFAQSLAMDKMKLEDYIQNQLEEQYGEHYAQKVEDRLLHYLHKLEMMLPRDTYIDQLLQKEHPVSYEDKLLLEVIAQGSTPIATSLKRLLQQGDKGCCPMEVSSKSAATAEVELVHLTEAAMNNISSRAPPRSEAATAPEVVLEDTTPEPTAACRHLSQDSPLLFAIEQQEEGCGVGGCKDVGCPKLKEGLVREAVEAVKKGDCSYKKRGPVNHTEQEEGDGYRREVEAGEEHQEEQLSQRSYDSERVASSSSSSSSSSLLQFCSKHQRWVRSILSECSEELQIQRDIASAPSPLLFPSSSSSSSQDLTPSGLVPCDLTQKPATSQTSSLNEATAQRPSQTPPMHNRGSGPAEEHVANGTGTQCVHPVYSSKDCSVATTAPTPSHYIAPSNFPCTPIHEPSAPQYCHRKSNEVPALSPPKPEAPLNSSDVKLTAGILPDGAQPQLAPAIAVPVFEQHQQALASTLPARNQQTVCVSHRSLPSARSLPPAHHLFSTFSRRCKREPVTARDTARALAQSSCVTVPERRRRLSRSSQQTPALFHPAPPVSSKDSSEVLALPSSSNLHTVSLSWTSTARATQYTELSSASISVLSPVLMISRCLLSPGSRSTLPGAVSTMTDGPPPLSISAQDLHTPSQLQLSLQPYVRLTRMHPQQYLREMECTETQLVEKQACDALGDPNDEGRGEGDQEEEEGTLYSDFDLNLLFSGDESSGSDSGDTEDPDYIPSRPRTRKLLLA